MITGSASITQVGPSWGLTADHSSAARVASSSTSNSRREAMGSLPPAGQQPLFDAQLVQYTGNDEVHQVFQCLRILVETRAGGQHRHSQPGQPQLVFQVDNR